MDAAADLRFAVQQCVVASGILDEVLHRVVAEACLRKLSSLAQDRRPGEEWVATAVIEVQMAVHHHVDVCQLHADAVERFLQRGSAGPIPLLGLGVSEAKARIQHHQAGVVSNQIAVHRFDPRPPRTRLF